jgi:hypothetical protein
MSANHCGRVVFSPQGSRRNRRRNVRFFTSEFTMFRAERSDVGQANSVAAADKTQVLNIPEFKSISNSRCRQLCSTPRGRWSVCGGRTLHETDSAVIGLGTGFDSQKRAIHGQRAATGTHRSAQLSSPTRVPVCVNSRFRNDVWREGAVGFVRERVMTPDTASPAIAERAIPTD